MAPRRVDIGRLPGRSHDSVWRIIGTAIGIAVTIVVVAIAVVTFVVPRVVGGSSLTVLTGSMEPTFNPGDVVAVRGIAQTDVCQHVRIGQIVTYLPQPNDPSLITHRVVAKTIGTFDDGTACRLATQGDANSAVDKPVSPVQVRGVFMYGVPKLGWVRQWSGDHLWVILSAGGLLILGYLVWENWRAPRTRVVSVDGPSAPGAQVAADAGTPAASDLAEADYEARLKDVVTRERDVARHEAELARLLGAALDASLTRGAPDGSDTLEIPTTFAPQTPRGPREQNSAHSSKS